MLRKFGIIAVLSLMALALAAVPALAARTTPTGNAQFQSGPTFTVNPETNAVTASGVITGIGSDTVDATLSVAATADVSCTNRGQNTVAAQQKLADVSTSANDLRPENGRLVFSLTSPAPSSLPAGVNPCPNRNWTPAVIPGTVDVTSATLTLIQNGAFVAGTPITQPL
jgi:hypothetical protein